MNFNFGEVLTRAWQIIWKHKILWVFGIFAGCSRGGGGGGGSGGSGTGPNGTQPFPEIERTFEQIGQWISENPWVVVALVIVTLALVILGIYLGTIGRIALIKGTSKAEQGVETLVFGELFSESGLYFWRVLGLSFVIGLIFILIFIPFALFGALTAGVGFLCLLPLICLLIPVAWAVTVVIEQANAAIVLEDLGISDGLRRGWEVVKSNVGTMILMSIILFISSGVIGIVIAIPVILAVFPLVFVFAAGEGNSPALWLWIVAACCAAYLPILLVLNGILTAYIQSAWALTYMRLTKPQENEPVVLLKANE